MREISIRIITDVLGVVPYLLDANVSRGVDDLGCNGSVGHFASEALCPDGGAGTKDASWNVVP